MTTKAAFDFRTRGERNRLISTLRDLRECADNTIGLVRVGSEAQLRAQIEDLVTRARAIADSVATTDESHVRLTRDGRR